MVIHARIAPKRDTTQNWQIHADFVPLNGEIIIYTDYKQTAEGENIPAIKVGNGVDVVADLPFIGDGHGPFTWGELAGIEI